MREELFVLLGGALHERSLEEDVSISGIFGVVLCLSAILLLQLIELLILRGNYCILE